MPQGHQTPPHPGHGMRPSVAPVGKNASGKGNPSRAQVMKAITKVRSSKSLSPAMKAAIIRKISKGAGVPAQSHSFKGAPATKGPYNVV